MIGAVLAAVSIATGAFGAHGLQPMIDKLAELDPELAVRRLDNWKTAAAYQMYQAIGLILIGLTCRVNGSNRWMTIAGFSMITGVLIFSGMLYMLVLTETRVLGAIVPLGGVAMIAGWLAFAIGVCRAKS